MCIHNTITFYIYKNDAEVTTYSVRALKYFESWQMWFTRYMFKKIPWTALITNETLPRTIYEERAIRRISKIEKLDTLDLLSEEKETE